MRDRYIPEGYGLDPARELACRDRQRRRARRAANVIVFLAWLSAFGIGWTAVHVIITGWR